VDSQQHKKKQSVQFGFIVFLQITLGTCGLSDGMNGLQMREERTLQINQRSSNTTLDETNQRLARKLFFFPERLALSVGKLLASCLLLIAGFFFALRKLSSIWWTAQAAIAASVWTVCDRLFRMIHINAVRSQLTKLFDAQVRVLWAETAASNKAPQLPISGVTMVHAYEIVLMMSGVVSIIFYFWLSRRVRRQDIKALLTAEQAS